MQYYGRILQTLFTSESCKELYWQKFFITFSHFNFCIYDCSESFIDFCPKVRNLGWQNRVGGHVPLHYFEDKQMNSPCPSFRRHRHVVMPLHISKFYAAPSNQRYTVSLCKLFRKYHLDYNKLSEYIVCSLML